MGTITFQVTEGGQPNAAKTFTVPDADIDRFVIAWQGEANVAINGTATRAQVLLTWANAMMKDAGDKVRTYELQKATSAIVIPPVTAT